ncbi:hypothetical protein [Jannaschia formosa]|uniref:hypothetical protein n=1 Tax=Jannaschia formosa TaxID=2259592 RepID=UPI001074C06E|nr:hypothetical protein [Jannaschia formosa]TFL19219.1 hypothetical protein DR046_04630 [Jannaschia formosa]
MTRPPPPADFDDNPPLDENFFSRAIPARREADILGRATEKNARLRTALEEIVRADAEGRSVREPIDRARALLAQE